jgi:hypothetical protein
LTCKTAGPEFQEFWRLLLQILNTRAEVLTWTVAMPFRIDTNFLPPKIVREELPNTFLMRLVDDLCLMPRAAAALWQVGELTFHCMAPP